MRISWYPSEAKCRNELLRQWTISLLEHDAIPELRQVTFCNKLCVCRVLDFPRSTIYPQQERESGSVISLHPVWRGPKPKIRDADLVIAIQADLDASPLIGEGHRKGLGAPASSATSVFPALDEPNTYFQHLSCQTIIYFGTTGKYG